MKYLATVVALVLSVGQICCPYVKAEIKGEESYFEDWSISQEYSEDYAITLEKEEGSDFVILSLSDIQLSNFETYDKRGLVAKRTIDYLIKKIKPDLIVLPGDNATSTSAYLKLIKDIDSYNIPWAPIMGNHDGSGCISEFWCALQLANAKNCLFKFGPKDMGYGNYIINIKENGNIIHTIYMMDTHNQADNNINGDWYDHLWQNQIDWYTWAVNGTKQIAGYNVESTVIMHIPVSEYKTAWQQAYDSDNGCYKAEYAATSYGENLEEVCCPNQNNGFFDVCLSLGSTKTIIAGHDHINDSSIVYKGIRLAYSLKCGPGSYWRAYKSGGTIISINSNGEASLSNEYVPFEKVSKGIAKHYATDWEN